MQTDFESLPGLRQARPEQRIVFRGGCFDLLHEGHVEALEFAKKQGDLLVVGVSSDERIKQRKGELRPVVSELSRLIVVDALRYVDFSFIVPLPEVSSVSPTLRVVRALRPDVFVDNGDTIADWPMHELDQIEAEGTEIVVDPYRDYRISTTHLIQKILNISGV